MVQNWNESIYIIKEENSIGSQFLNIVNNSIIAKKLYYEKIGTIDYDINDALFIYEIREHDWVAIISNNHLLLKDEGQRRKYVDEYINFISKITTNKRIRKTIPKSVKSKLWIQHFGEEVANGNCYVCETKIRIDNFEAGHVIPDSQDGQPTIDNLKPVCSLCNKSMGDENLYDYKEKHFPEKNRSFGGRSFAPLIPLYPSPKTKNLI
jgi:5-methylcytosine-specific restriction endonuclease McrA